MWIWCPSPPTTSPMRCLVGGWKWAFSRPNDAAGSGISSVGIRRRGRIGGRRRRGWRTLLWLIPMSSHLLVKEARVGPAAFSMPAEHQRELPRFTNQYVRCSTDSMLPPGPRSQAGDIAVNVYDQLSRWMTFLPTTGTLARPGSCCRARRARRLTERRPASRRGGVEVVDWTSPSNAGFANALSCYSRVVTYDALASLDPSVPTVYLRFRRQRCATG